MNCPICKTSAVTLLYQDVADSVYPEIPEKYQVKQCGKCALIFVDPQPSPEQLAKHYPDQYPVYNREKPSISKARKFVTRLIGKQFLGYGKRSWWRFLFFPLYPKLAHLPEYQKDGLILDVGCTVGSRFPAFEVLGWRVRGIEMSDKAAKAAREIGYDVTCSSFENADLPENAFEAVYMSHVFEHFANPELVLQKARKILKPGGELILNLPNAGGLASRTFGKHWFGLEIPRHLFSYNTKNIQTLLRQHDFKVQRVCTSFALGSLTSSLSYRLGKPAGSLSILDKPFWFMDLLLDAALYPFRIGDWMTLHARKDS